MLGLVAGLALAALIASPQLVASLRYYPRSIRSSKSAADKQALGSVPLPRLLLAGLTTRIPDQVDGVFYPEVCWYVGLVGLLCTTYAPLSWGHGVLVLAGLLAMGRRTPVFRWTAWAHLRIPARYCFVICLTCAALAISGYARLAPPAQRILLYLLMADLAWNLPHLWPMHPYVQRWQRPAEAFNTPLTRYLQDRPERVSGLPYPLRTGQVNQIHTLGYNGGSQARWMARFRGDTNPNGSGGHDWFALNADGPQLDGYGVKYAYTYRPLRGKWQATLVPHLYVNTQCQAVPTWKEVAAQWDAPQ